MKIFIFSSVHPWNDTRVFYKETVSLAKNGYRVKLCAIENNVKYDGMYENLQVDYLPKVRRLTRPFLWLRLFIKALREKADVYHFHDPELLLIGYLLKVFTKSKVIYDMHEDFPAAIKSKPWIPKKIRRRLSRIIAYVEKVLIKKCDAVIFAEKYYKENYTDINITKEDILNYPLNNNQLDSMKKYETPTVVYAGGISKIRGFFEMLKAAKSLNDRGQIFNMVIIGNINEELKNEAIAYIKENNLSKIVQLPGRLPLSEVYSYYNKSHVGLAILHPEENYLRSLATKIFEYMSVSIPVVASNFPEWKELIENEQCGEVVDPYNIEQIADKIEFLLKENDYALQLGLNGFNAYTQKYNWEVEENKLYNLYNQLI
ncbi:glycosyltransferase family 4 protein [Microbacteriaceae bacterium 4G12]